MWRCKLFVLHLLFAGTAVTAQVDSSIYLRNASLIDQLLPAPKFTAFFPPVMQTDSSLAVRYDAFKGLVITAWTFNEPQYRHTFRWDRNGLPDQYYSEAGDKGQAKVSEYNFVYANKSLIKVTRSDVGRNDTIWLSWTRGGKPATTCLREGDSLVCDNRLYDGRGRLVVLENAKYATQRGIFTYSYDDKGRLQTRTFNDIRWGYLICTDSLAYTFIDDNKTLLSTKHWLRVTGTGKVTLIDEKITQMDGKVTRYEYYGIQSPQSRFLPSPGGYVDFTYDTLRRPATETYGYAGTGPKFFAEHQYSDTADVMLLYAYTGTKKKIKKELVEKHVTTYGYAGNAAAREKFIISKEGKAYRKGKKGKPEEEKLLYRHTYEWKK